MMSVNNGIRNNEAVCHFSVMASQMDELRMLEIFEATNKLLYARSVQRINKDELTQTEKKLFTDRLNLFQENHVLLGYWGIFSIPFRNRPGFVLQSYFFHNSHVSSIYYEKVNLHVISKERPIPKMETNCCLKSLKKKFSLSREF